MQKKKKTYNEMALALVGFQIKLIYHIIFFFFHNHNHIHKLTNLDFFFFSLPPSAPRNILATPPPFLHMDRIIFRAFFLPVVHGKRSRVFSCEPNRPLK